MPRQRFAIKRYDGDGSTGFAIFKASQVRSKGDYISWEEGISPVRGYSGLSEPEAECIKERLEKELK